MNVRIESMQKIRKALDVCDECPNSKYAKVFIVPSNEPDVTLAVIAKVS